MLRREPVLAWFIVAAILSLPLVIIGVLLLVLPAPTNEAGRSIDIGMILLIIGVGLAAGNILVAGAVVGARPGCVGRTMPGAAAANKMETAAAQDGDLSEETIETDGSSSVQ